MNRNKRLLIDVMDNLMMNDPMYDDSKMQEEIKHHITTCIEEISNSAWISSRRSADLIRMMCQSYVAALDHPLHKKLRVSKFD